MRHVEMGELGLDPGSATGSGLEPSRGLRGAAERSREVDHIGGPYPGIAVGGVASYRVGEVSVQEAGSGVNDLFYELCLASPPAGGLMAARIGRALPASTR